jgi:hypothetical protein
MSDEYLRDEGAGLPPLPPAPVASPSVRYARPPKSAAAATLLSLFPGLGQIYNGQPAKALVFFFAQVASIYAASTIDGMPYGFFIPFVYLYNLIDAWRSAVMINARAAGGAAPLDEDGTESPAWGGTLIGIGALLLFNNLGWLNLAAMQRYWPVLLIIAGGALLSGSLRRKRNGGHAGL